MLPNGQQWNMPGINDQVSSLSISKIPIPKLGTPDWLAWTAAASGSHSVKKSYQLLANFQDSQRIYHLPWSELWKLQVLPRVKICLVTLLPFHSYCGFLASKTCSNLYRMSFFVLMNRKQFNICSFNIILPELLVGLPSCSHNSSYSASEYCRLVSFLFTSRGTIHMLINNLQFLLRPPV